MKQTAVEWLEMELNKLPFDIIRIYESYIYQPIDILKTFDQAKAMEKEQIIEAVLSNCYIGGATEEEAEQYYNETFKSE